MNKAESIAALDRCLEGLEYFREEVRRRNEENERTLKHQEPVIDLSAGNCCS